MTTPPPNSDATAGPEADVEQDLSAAQQELTELKDRFLRLAADFENYKRRAQQEVDRRAGAQKEAFILELLPVLDNLERALAAGQAATLEQLRDGVQMTLQQMQQLLRKHGIEPEDSLGRPFDPRRHEAVATRHDPSQPDHVILEVSQRGYRRGSEVFRPAKVITNDLHAG